ncbi:DUF5305 family protein [Halomarina rubra]|uniref:DUF5305 family protein n=1 Tax=Halomarina rubra TaxID=2071873 RepID=A0ABD6B1F5_9EURY|nr:DUF5305 family protein [Halomarina rubra]
MIPGLTKLRLLLADYDREVAAVLVIIGILSLTSVGVLLLTPGTTAVTEQRNPQQVGATVNTSAVVTGNSTVWEQGTQLENEEMYLVEASPNLTLSATSAADTAATIDQRLELVYRVENGDKTVWERSETLAQDNVTNSEGVTTNTTLNASAVQQRLDEIQAEFSGAGRAQALIQLNLTYDMGAYEGSQIASSQLTFEGRGYTLGALSTEKTHTTPVTVEQATPVSPVLLGGLTLLGLCSFAGAAFIMTQQNAFEPTAARAELLHDRHREWISEAQLSEVDLAADRVVHLSSLTDLVDLAIDSDRRVMHDSDRRLYAVFDGSTSYYYRDASSISIESLESHQDDSSDTSGALPADD